MWDWLRTSTGRVIVIVLFACAGWIAAAARPSVMNRVEMPVFDNWLALVDPPPVGEKIIVVLATEASMREFGHWPWSRSIHAGFLQRLQESSHIILDVLFPEPSTPEQDRILAETVEKLDKVTLAIHIAPGDNGGEPRLLLPYRELAAAGEGFGVANVKPEPDGVYRDAHMFWIHKGEFIPSLPLAAWLVARGEIPDLTETPDGYVVNMPTGPLALDKSSGFKVHHPDDSVPVYEYADVYTGRIAAETFRDAIVFVGVNTAGASDFLPVGRGEILPGALYNAHAAETLFHGWIPVAAPGGASGLAGAILAGIGATAGLFGKKVWRGWLWLFLVAAAWCLVDIWLFLGYRLWLPPVFPALLCFASYFFTSIIHLRFLSAAWQMQNLSIDSLLFITRQDVDPELSFAQHLRDNWHKIQSMSGLDLIQADVADDDPDVRSCLERTETPAKSRADNFDAHATVALSRQAGHRLLVRLPSWEEGVSRYAVLGWHGSKSPETLKSVAALVISAATNFQAVRETRAKRELFVGVIRLIMRAVDAKDPFTAGHSERVATLAKWLAERLKLPQRVIDEIYLGGLLHDVGKLGVPDAILCKPGRLTDDEMGVMRGHPELGEGLLGEIVVPEIVMRAIVEHHERVDGKGYPRGLKQEQLSLVGRMLKVADVYDALVSKRQYKEPFPLEKAYQILANGAGTEFDREIVNLVLEEPFPQLSNAHSVQVAETA